MIAQHHYTGLKIRLTDTGFSAQPFSQYPFRGPDKEMGMGYSMRTDRYRYTEWTIPKTDYIERELYDHRVDSKENVNIVYILRIS